jgi:hypothetical protein
MEQHRKKTNQMDCSHLETQWTRKEYNRRKYRRKCPKRKAKGQIHGTNKDESTLQEIPGSNNLAIDRDGRL